MSKGYRIFKCGKSKTIVLELPSGKELVLTETIGKKGESKLEIISQMTDHDVIEFVKQTTNSIVLKLDFKVDI